MKKEILSSTYPSKLNKTFWFYHGGFLIKKKNPIYFKTLYIYDTEKH